MPPRCDRCGLRHMGWWCADGIDGFSGRPTGKRIEGVKMRYRCIKEMYIPTCDGDGSEIPNEYGIVMVGSIWEKNDDMIVAGDVHLDALEGGFEWIEISFEDLHENFILIER